MPAKPTKPFPDKTRICKTTIQDADCAQSRYLQWGSVCMPQYNKLIQVCAPWLHATASKKRPTSTTKPHYLCGWISNIGQPPVASARNMCARKKSRSRVSQFVQSLAQNAAHATRHAYLGTRHNVRYGTTTEQNGVESTRGTLKTNYCLVDHVRSLDPVPQRMKHLFWERPGACCKVCKKSATHAF